MTYLIFSAIVDVINYRMKQYTFAFKGYSGYSRIDIPCYGDILEMIKNEAPTYKIYWDKNGEGLTEPLPLHKINTSNFGYCKCSNDIIF